MESGISSILLRGYSQLSPLLNISVTAGAARTNLSQCFVSLVLVLSVKPVLWLVLSSLIGFTSRASMQTHLFVCRTYNTNKCLQPSRIPRVKIPVPNRNTFGSVHAVHILHPNKVQPRVLRTQPNKGLLHYLRHSPGKSLPACVNAEARKTKYGSRPGRSSVCWQRQSKNQSA